jgi:hypothetical protein
MGNGHTQPYNMRQQQQHPMLLAVLIGQHAAGELGQLCGDQVGMPHQLKSSYTQLQQHPTTARKQQHDISPPNSIHPGSGC